MGRPNPLAKCWVSVGDGLCDQPAVDSISNVVNGQKYNTPACAKHLAEHNRRAAEQRKTATRRAR